MELDMVRYGDRRNYCHAVRLWSKWNDWTNIKWKSELVERKALTYPA